MNNSYVTREDFLKWVTPQDTAADSVDDAVIDDILVAASRYIDGSCVREFYPFIATDYLDIPDSRELYVARDLLSVVSFLNGNGTEIESTEYNLVPRNISPHYMIKLKSSSSIYWETDSDGEFESVIKLTSECGYHNNYSVRAWETNDALDATGIADVTTKTFNTASTANIKAGNIIKIDSEIMNVSGVSDDEITVQSRGDNGSTAVTHAAGTAIYIWRVQADIAQAVKLIAQSLYRRFGHINQADENIVTASGVVITPKDVPGLAARTIRQYRRRL